MKQSLRIGWIGALFIALPCYAQDQCSLVIDQEQDASTLANFASIPDEICYLGNNVQSFTPTYDNVAVIALRLGSVFSYGITFQVGIFEDLPNAGVQAVAETLVSVEGPKFSHWVSADFGRVPVTPGGTYYIGFCHIGGQTGYIEGSHFDPYPYGILYGLGGDLIFGDYDLTFKTFANPCPLIDVDIDIKPGSYPNSINLCSSGVVPVALLGTSAFDVADVNTSTLRFAESAAKVIGKKDPHSLCSYEDVNDDGFVDLVCQFVTTDLAAIDGESSIATVNGELGDGTPIQGTDSVSTVKETCN